MPRFSLDFSMPISNSALRPGATLLLCALARVSQAQSRALPVLDPLPVKGGVCHTIPESPSSRRLGSVRTALFDLASPDRGISVSVDASARPVYFSARATGASAVTAGTDTSSTAPAPPREIVLAFFERDGSIRSGERLRRTGSGVAGASTETKRPLARTDTTLVKKLAAAVIARCMR